MLQSCSKYKFYEKYIKYQIADIIERNLWGTPRWKNVLSNIWNFRVFLSIILTSSIFLITLFYYTRSNINLNKSIIDKNHSIYSLNFDKNRLINIISYKDLIIDSMNDYLKSREYIEFVVKKRSHMDDFNINISRIDDDILFLMVEQANKYKIPYTIYFRLIDRESGFKCSYMLSRSYNYWKSKGKSDKESWEFCLSEYNTGRGNMQIKKNGKVSGYFIPNYTRSYINYIMKYYK